MGVFLMPATAGAILGGIAFVVLLFSKTPRRPALPTRLTVGWFAALFAGAVFIAFFLSGPNLGMHSRMAIFINGIGQFLAIILVGLMSAGLTSLLPEAKRPNFIRTTLQLSTIVFSLSVVGQLAPK